MYRGKVILMEEFDENSSLVDSFKEENSVANSFKEEYLIVNSFKEGNSGEIHKERNRSLTVAQIEQNK